MDDDKVDHGTRDGSVVQPTELCTNTGERVMEVLRTKHPDARPPTATSLDTYPDPPTELVPMDITDDMVTEVARQLSGGAAIFEMELVSLQYWLLRFGMASGELRMIVADFAEWLSNGCPNGPPTEL